MTTVQEAGRMGGLKHSAAKRASAKRNATAYWESVRNGTRPAPVHTHGPHHAQLCAGPLVDKVDSVTGAPLVDKRGEPMGEGQ